MTRAANRPPTADELATAERMLDDGASVREVERTLGRTRNSLKRYLAGRGWTRSEAGKHSAMMRRIS